MTLYDPAINDNFYHSNKFDYNKTIDSKSISMLARTILVEIKLEIPKYINYIEVILANLISNYNSNKKYTAFSKRRLNIPEKYNKFKLGYTRFLRTIHKLELAKYIFVKNGFNDRRFCGDKFTSRMCQTNMLVELINKTKETNIRIKQHKNQEVIFRKNIDGIKSDYYNSRDVEYKRKRVRKYIELLRKTDIRVNTKNLSNDQLEKLEKLDLSNKHIYRTFNNSSWSQGGRFYGPWWQNANNIIRREIIISGHRTVEWDYNSQHMGLLYAMEGVDFNTIGIDDAYSLPGYPKTEKWRRLIKKFLLISFNTITEDSAISALKKAVLSDGPSKYPPKEEWSDFSKIIKIFKEVHNPIARRLCTCLGVKVQYVDSMICDYIINRLTIDKKPVLTIHDSFIVEEQHEEILKDLMKKAHKEVVKKHYGIDVTSPKISKN